MSLFRNPFVYIFWFFALLLGIGSSHAQNTLDSLRNIVDQPSDPLSRVQNTHLLASTLLKSRPAESLSLLKEVLPIADSLNDPILAEIWYTMARAYDAQKQLDSALIAYQTTFVKASHYGNNLLIVSSLTEQGYAYSQKNQLDKSLSFSKRAYKVAEESGEKRPLLRASNNLGRIYSFIEEFDSASIYLFQALSILNEIEQDKRLIAEMHINISNNEYLAQKNASGDEQVYKALGLMEELNDSSGICFCYRALGTNHYFLGEYPKAISFYHKAVDISKRTKLYNDHIINLDYLGEAYFTAEDYVNAQTYWEQAMETWQIANDDEKNADFLFKQGRVLLLQKKNKKALDALTEAKLLMEASGRYVNGDWYWYLGQANERLGNDDDAIASYQLAIERAPTENSQGTTVRGLYGLGQISEKQQAYEQALAYYEEGYKITQGFPLKENEMDLANGLYRINKRKGNHRSALEYLEIAKSIQDSLFNKKNTRDIARLQASFEFEQEKQELAFVQTQELERQSNIRQVLWGALVLTSILLFVATLYFRNKQKANRQLTLLNTQIQHQKEKLEELDESKSRFFTNISHEFRTPLTIILGMIKRIAAKPELHFEKGMQMINRNAENLLDLINQILDLRKLESKELKLNNKEGDVVSYLKYLTESYSYHAKQQGLSLHFDSKLEALRMDYDAEKLLRVVSNLLSNAVKFTPEGGKVYFRLEQVKEGSTNSLSLEIEDTGIGISPENLPYVFNRFYQEDDSLTRSGEGTGIGLALSQELVKLMGGSIAVSSEVGRGSLFTVRLPITNLASEQHQASAEKNAELTELIPTGSIPAVQPANEEIGESLVGEKTKLLIVEDNVDVQQYLLAALEGEYEVEIAENGLIGIEKAIETIPDLIISDVMMPEKDGFELTDVLKQDERTSHIPIILLTAKADIDSKISGLEKGADAYLAKPFEEKELFVRIDKLLELRKKLQERYGNLDPSTIDSAKPIEDPFLQKLLAYIEEHISDAKLNMEQLSKAMGMSRIQVFRKLKALTGKSPSLFIRSFRLNKGKHLIATTDLTISEVAYDVGFTSLSYFSTAFMDEFGLRPSGIRK